MSGTSTGTGPRTVVLHTVGAFFGDDAVPALRDELHDRIEDLDLAVASTPASSRDLIADAEVVLTHTLPGDLLERAPDLAWVQALSAGVDAYDREALDEAGVVLTDVSGAHAEPVAEQVLGYLLLFERDLLRGLDQQRAGVWERYRGGELAGRTLGVVGLGAIGTRVAELGAALGMTVLGTKRDPTDAPAVVDDVFGPDDLDEVLAASDYVVLACPLTPETRGLLGPDRLDTMRSSAVLVNVARGEIVDEAALAERLQQGQLGGAALDVFETEPLPPESPLWDLSNVVVTPHMAGFTPHLWTRVADIVAANYQRFVAGELA